jgi:hypothetical protein
MSRGCEGRRVHHETHTSHNKRRQAMTDERENTTTPTFHCNPENIHETLRMLPVWVGWGGHKLDGKINKKPVRLPWTEEGKHPLRTEHFDQAVERIARLAHQGRWDDYGVGIDSAALLRHRMVILDLDKCIDHPDAHTLIEECGTYTETSPSGNGYHLVLSVESSEKLGVRHFDSTGPFGNVQGEVFAGAGYVTITGAVLGPAHVKIRPAPDWVEESFRKLAAPEGVAGEVPIPGDESAPEHCQIDEAKDRSRQVFAWARRMAGHATSAEQLFSWVVNDPTVWEVALSKRQGSDTKAFEYLWRHHASKAYESHVAEAESMFDDLGPGEVEVDEGAENMFRSADDIADEARTPDWVVQGLFERGELVFLSGPSSVGKSFIALDMAAHITAGRDWMGRQCAEGPVFYFAGEGMLGFKRRLAGLRQHKFAAPDLFVFQGTLDLTDPRTLDIAVSHIRALVRQSPKPVQMVLIDTLSKFSHKDENDNTVMASWIAALKRKVAHALGVTVVIIAHPKKDSTDGVVRGASALQNDADVTLLAMPKVIGEEVQRGLVEVKTDIVRDTDKGFELTLKLQQVAVTFEDGMDTTCIIEQVGQELVGQMEEAASDAMYHRVLAVLTDETKTQTQVMNLVNADGGRALRRGRVKELLMAIEDRGWATSHELQDRNGSDRWVATYESGRDLLD